MAHRRWVAIQRNRKSGRGGQYPVLMSLIRALRRFGLTPRLFSKREELDRAVLAHANLASTPQLGEWGELYGIVAAGGDGTVLDLLNRHPSIPVAVLPLGTENLLARHLGIPRRDGEFVARMIADGLITKIDLGQVNGGRFATVASCGFDAEVIHRLYQSRSGNIRHWHYVRPVLASLWNFPFPELRVTIDDSTEPVTGGMVVVANLPDYAFRLPLVPTAIGNDGLLDVRVFPHRSAWGFVRDFLRVCLRRHEWLPQVSRFRAKRIRIEATGPFPVQADGDSVAVTPVTIEVLPLAARLFVPQTSSQTPVEPQ
ncbi:MAG: diacylglycerol kinase family protein [Planctomycetaceae bacterium]